jgi:hypothetical protein
MPLPSRKFNQTPWSQGSQEHIAYEIDFTKWNPNSTPITNQTATLIDITNGYVDVTATKMSGASTILGNIVTTPLIHDLVADVQYRLNVYIDVDGNTLEAWGIIIGET